MIVATPSGVTLAPEGGAHQSIHTPLIGIGQPGLLSYEPAHVDELAVLMRHGLDYMQQDKGGSVYLRLSTRSLPQPAAHARRPSRRADIVVGRLLVCRAGARRRHRHRRHGRGHARRRSPRMKAWRATSPAPGCWS